MATGTLTDRVFNFSPGPAVLPLPVLEQAQRELVSLPGYGMSVLEMSHRSQGFLDILADTKRLLTELLGIPANYHIIFLQGGSRLQFSMVPMNLLRGQSQPADYLVTGSWSKYAIVEAQREGAVNVAWDGKSTNYDRLPAASDLKLNPSAPYVYLCSNETMPIEKYGLLYACAQKNAGPAGVTAVIIRDDLAKRGGDYLPGYLNYANHVKEDSLYNTPPTFAIYLMRLVCLWLRDEIGGLAKMHALNKQKARLLYDAIDGSGGFYRGHAQASVRSLMNVTFRLPSEQLEKEFVKLGEERNLDGLKGHRSVGGIRASIYNAMPLAGVEALAEFMKEFKASRG
jgi:phosphoserine aminotransferase